MSRRRLTLTRRWLRSSANLLAGWLAGDSLAPLLSGSLVIGYRGAAARPWSAAWQFTGEDGTTWHAVLAGDDGIHQLRPGTAEHPANTGELDRKSTRVNSSHAN